MNGTIFIGLRKYIQEKLGPAAWAGFLDETGIGRQLYIPLQEYPDQEASALIAAASKRMGTPVAAVLEDFGEFLVPDLFRMFANLINPRWKTLDLIANVERSIHEVLRSVSDTARPPRLECTRTGDGEVVIVYASPRRMCSLAKGIAKGVARHYGEQIEITEPLCMHRGSPRCEMKVALVQ